MLDLVNVLFKNAPRRGTGPYAEEDMYDMSRGRVTVELWGSKCSTVTITDKCGNHFDCQVNDFAKLEKELGNE